MHDRVLRRGWQRDRRTGSFVTRAFVGQLDVRFVARRKNEGYWKLKFRKKRLEKYTSGIRFRDAGITMRSFCPPGQSFFLSLYLSPAPSFQIAIDSVTVQASYRPFVTSGTRNCRKYRPYHISLSRSTLWRAVSCRKGEISPLRIIRRYLNATSLNMRAIRSFLFLFLARRD